MQERIVYIIGAGASNEANLPDGIELKQKISNHLNFYSKDDSILDGGNKIYRAIRLLVGKESNPYIEATMVIRKALLLAGSIDNLIDAHHGNEKIALCSKLAIVQSILEAENESLLSFSKSSTGSSINFHALQKTWYWHFFDRIISNCSDLKERFKSITLIVFNYDRCIEHFIYFALQDYLAIPAFEAAELVKCINIYHPYGSVGNLPWYSQTNNMEFGANPNPQKLLELAKKIKTFSEGTNPDSSEIFDIRRNILNANILVFLGFAFHGLSMQMIKPDNIEGVKVRRKECYATAKGISRNDIPYIKEEIKGYYGFNSKDIMMINIPCIDFFLYLKRALAFKK
ncbi:hypothetical protein ACFLTI_09390 [Bacteroidota bacterium]